MSLARFGLSPGDHISIARPGYDHHGVVYDQFRVAHFWGSPGNKANACIQITSLAEFLDGGDIQKLKTVRRAAAHERSRIREHIDQQVGMCNYALFSRNCEHFARLVTTGEARSTQTDWVVGLFKVAVVAAVGFAAVKLLSAK